MSDENWLEKALHEGRLDKMREQSDREYDEGRALDTLESDSGLSDSSMNQVVDEAEASISRMIRKSDYDSDGVREIIRNACDYVRRAASRRARV